jgi:site-specific DNA-methyltransferase (adenine-specific)
LSAAEKVTIGYAELWCGDCLDLIDRLPKNAAIVSDPPYGIGYVHCGGDFKLAELTTVKPIIGDDHPFDPSPWLAWKKVSLFGADHFLTALPGDGHLACFDKSLGKTSKDTFSDGEFVWSTGRTRRNVYRHIWKGIIRDRSDATDRHKGQNRLHVSQKPVGAMRWAIDMLTLGAGDTIIDPYMGSGSTGIAALSLGMRFIGIEIDREIFDLACERIASYFATHVDHSPCPDS